MSIVLSDSLGLRDLDPRRLSDGSSMSRRLSCVVENLMSSDGNHQSTNENDPKQPDIGSMTRRLSRLVGNAIGVHFDEPNGKSEQNNGVNADADKDLSDEVSDRSDFLEFPDDDRVDLNREMEKCGMNKKEGAMLLFIFIAYLLLGGVVFMALESKHEQKQRSEVIQRMQEVDNKLFQADQHNFTRESLRGIINELADARSLGLIDSYGNQTHAKWDFANSVFFAITVVTTIGYGHLYPATPFGRTFCVLYGMLGIPLTGILLASIGDHFSIQLMRALNKAKRIHTSKFAIAINTVSVFIPWLLVFVFLPGGLFMVLENWSYDVALYYSFVTLATIGFGDFVAASNDVEYIWLYKIMLIAWIIFGLGYLSTILNFISKAMQSKKLKNVEDRISEKFNRFKIVIDNARSRRRFSTRRGRSSEVRNGVSSSKKQQQQHRRSRSLDFDAMDVMSTKSSSSPKWHVKDIVIESIIQTSDEMLSEESFAPSNDTKPRARWASILERNNNKRKFKGSLTNQMKKSLSTNASCSDVSSTCEIVIQNEEERPPSEKMVQRLFDSLENGKVTDL